MVKNNDNENESIEDMLNEIFEEIFGCSSNEGLPLEEYWGDDELLYGTEKDFKDAKCWDDYPRNSEKSEITNLDIYDDQKCPYLLQPRDSEFFFYCRKIADGFVREGTVKYSGNVPKMLSAEFFGRRTLYTLKHCIYSKFLECDFYRDADI